MIVRQVASLLVSLCLVWPPATLAAAPLADKVPAGSGLYFGWSGADAIKGEFEKSRLRAVLVDSKIDQLMGRFFDSVLARIAREGGKDPGVTAALETARLVRDVLVASWQYPTAVYIEPMTDAAGRLAVRGGVLIAAGDAEPKVETNLRRLIEQAGEPPIPLLLSSEPGLVALTWATAGTEPGRPWLDRSAKLNQSPAFTSALERVGDKPAAVLYVDIASVLSAVEPVVLAQADASTQETIKAVIDDTGLRQVRTLISVGGFEADMWSERVHVATDGPLTGLLGRIDAGAIDPEQLRVVPADATFVAIGTFDLAAFMESARDTIANAGPDGEDFATRAVGGLNGLFGLRLIEDLLQPLGSQWVIYNSPTVNGTSVLSGVVVLNLDDAARIRRNLRRSSITLMNYLNTLIGAQDGAPPVAVAGKSTKVGDIEVSYLGLPLLAPAYAIEGDRLYLGLFPQSVVSAVRHARKGGNSVLESPLLAQAMNLAPEGAQLRGLYAIDLPRVAGVNSMHPTLMLLARYAGIADLFDLTLPEPLVPPLDTLLAQLTPAVAVSWMDDSGYNIRTLEAFPGSRLTSEHGLLGMSGTALPLMAAAAVPALATARDQVRAARSSSNLRQIAAAVMIYVGENNGRMPGAIEQLDGYLGEASAIVLDSPLGDRPDGDYVYLPKQSIRVTQIHDVAALVIAYDAAALEGDVQQVPLAYADGHVESHSPEEARRQIQQSRQRLEELKNR